MIHQKFEKMDLKQEKQLKRIEKVAFVYLSQETSHYMISKNLEFDVQRRPLLGLQYLCAVLEEKRIKTVMFDQVSTPFSLKELIEKLREYDLTGFYCSDAQEDKLKIYSKKIREKLKIPLIIGGPGTLSNTSYLDSSFDIVVHGEGEITMWQIIEYYNGKRKLEEINGISYKKNNKIIASLPQEVIKNLDELPFPDRSKIDINAYYDYFIFGMKTPYITMIASRGCIYRCTFCTTYAIWNNQYRRRSVDNVLAEIDYVVKRYGTNYIAFQDDVFGRTNDWIEEFCKKLIIRNYKFKWMVILHPFSVRNDTERILKLMKKARCDTISFGQQSSHPKILKNIKRNPAEPMQLKKILKITNKLGLVTSVSYIFGLPGDTKETIRTTINYSLNCGSTVAHYFILSVLSGSEIGIQYRNKEICKMPKNELGKLATYASRKFYTRPKNLLKIVYFVIKNPGWVMRVGIKLPSILQRIGFGKTRFKE